MESIGSVIAFGIISLLFFHGVDCSLERLKLRLGLLSERLDMETLSRRTEAKILKDKLEYLQDTLNNMTVDNVDGIKKEELNTTNEKKQYDKLASVMKRAFAAEKRLNERVRRNVAVIEANVNDLYREQLGMFQNISNEAVSIRENVVKSNDDWKVCADEIQDLNEKVNTIFNIVKTKPWEVEIKNVLEKVSAVIDQVKIESRKFESCQYMLMNGVRESGVYDIYPNGPATPVRVYCDQVTDGGGWIVIQRRQDGTVDFYREWADYKNGFGDLEGEFWLGNEYIHKLTHFGNRELRIDMEDFELEKRFAKYTKFKVGSESEKYSLHIDGYTGDAGDSLSYHNGSPFSTKDRDNDLNSCSTYYNSAWWYKNVIVRSLMESTFMGSMMKKATE